MQREIKKRALLYGVVAVLSAIVVSAFAYNLQFYAPESQPPSPSGLLKTFSSYNDLRSFLMTNSKTQGAFPFYGPWDRGILERAGMFTSGAQPQAFSAPGLEFEYSTTNIQVAGVDEADTVKTDGEHIYLVSGNNVTILKAYPPEEAEVLSKITFNDMYPLGIFASPNRLVVLGSKYTSPQPTYIEPFSPQADYYKPFIVDIKTFVEVYDISEKTQPAFLTSFTMSGSYFNSRMIGDYVYFVVSQPAYVIYDTVVLPKIYSVYGIREISPSEIHYSNTSDNYYMFTTVVALNVQNTAEEPTTRTLMLGGTSNMYVSLNNIYITFPEPERKTSIYRIRIDKNTLLEEAKGKVQGSPLNQFSMDEYNNHFRIATATWVNGTPRSNVYVLDMNLSMVGSLENIALGENMDSTRFIGNRCYLSTSVVRRDPFFVIDVENASNPKILGDLKIPGFTRYLHPYDEDRVIGIGKDGNIVKISLFDVSNVSKPIEIDKYTVDGTWSDTPVLTEHKAFLFARSKDLLVIPVSIQQTYWDKYSMWQGAYVFNITLTDIALKSGITHQGTDESVWDSRYWVKRSLYIENVLYTVSEKKIKMNSLDDLTLINTIEFP